MNEFIKLTFGEEPLFVKASMISSFYRDDFNKLTNLYIAGESECYHVKETPDEILDLINGK